MYITIEARPLSRCNFGTRIVTGVRCLERPVGVVDDRGLRLPIEGSHPCESRVPIRLHPICVFVCPAEEREVWTER